MFVVVVFDESRRKFGFGQKRITTKEIKAKDFSFLQINVGTKKGKYRKSKIERLVKKFRCPVIFSYDSPVSLRQKYQTNTSYYRNILTFNAFEKFVKQQKRQNLEVGIYDPNGTVLNLANPIIEHAEKTLIYTLQLEMFTNLQNTSLSLYGTSPYFCQNKEKLISCKAVFWNDETSGLGDVVFGPSNLMADSAMLPIPQYITEVIPEGVDSVDFLAAIYEETTKQSLLKIVPIYLKEGENFVQIKQKFS